MVWAEVCDSVKQCNYTECEINGTIVFYLNTLRGCLIYTQRAYERSVYKMYMYLRSEHCVTHSGNTVNKT